MSKQQRAVVELIIASGFWGFGFIAAIWALKKWNPVEVSVYRFALAAGVGFFIHAVSRTFDRQEFIKTFKLVWPTGLFLAATIVLQSWGLNYTTATKSGFITTLYVLMVPILEFWLLKMKVKRIFFLWVSMAIIGAALLVNFITLSSVGSLNFGDFLTFLCAIAAAFQIFLVGKYVDKIKSPFLFNNVQTLWAFIFCLPLMLLPAADVATNAQVSTESHAIVPWAGLFMLSFGSTLLAFYLQVRAQRYLKASVSSFIFLLESPLAFLYAALIFGETLTLTEVIGAILIVIAAVGVTWQALQSEKTTVPAN